MITIIKWDELGAAEQKKILERPGYKMNKLMQEKVAKIIQEVRREGDKAVREFTYLFDGVELNELHVTEKEICQARQKISAEAYETMRFAHDQIFKFHKLQQQSATSIEMANEVYCSRQTRPIQQIGLYIPGGEAPLPSTVLMLGVPAKIAGCKRIAMCTPPKEGGRIDPHILVAAELCGITEIYKIGGAQAIAVLAYGTESIPKVDKIFGPGNAWVTTAKSAVMHDIEGAVCDLPAGPSELVVICDDQANPEFAAADLLSQAEHSNDAQVLLITDCIDIATAVLDALNNQLVRLSRQAVCRQSLTFAKIIVVDELATAFKISEVYAPEHLSVQVKNADMWLPLIHNAGAVFVGEWTAQTLGDYVMGSNHVLPTYGFSKVYSGLCVNDFLKHINFHHVSASGFKNIAQPAISLATIEQLDAHRNAVAIRLGSLA